MSTRGGELIATDEPTVITKSLLDLIVVDNSQGDGGLANSASTDESNWNQVLSEIDYLLDQLVASKKGPRGRGRAFPRFARSKYKILGPLVAWIADLIRV